MVRCTTFPTITQFRHLSSVSTAQLRAPNITNNITILQKVPTCLSGVRKQKINTEISSKIWQHWQNWEFTLIKEINENRLTVKQLTSTWTKAACLSKEAVINSNNTGQLAQISLPSQLVLKGRGSIYRQPAGMYKAQQRHRMEVPVNGAAHSLSLQSQSPHLYALHFPRNLERHISQHTEHPAQQGQSPQLRIFSITS